MVIDSIERGVVIDHIAAGKGMEIYRYLGLEGQDGTVAILRNVKSNRLGRKDIIKIEDRIDLDLDALGYIDPNITVNIIEQGAITSKLKLSLPGRLTNVLACKNPRCITTAEPGIPQQFALANPVTRTYRCVYCEQEA